MSRQARTSLGALRAESEAALHERAELPASTRITGKIRWLETGLNHDNYLFYLDRDAPPSYSSDTPFVLRKIKRFDRGDSLEEAMERLRTEARTLEALAAHHTEFRVPRFVCFVGEESERPTGFIETGLSGLPFEAMRKLADKRDFTIQSLAQIAAEIHHLPAQDFTWLPTHADSRAHVLADLQAVPRTVLDTDALATSAVDWIKGHLPRDRPAVLLHGDLLPQNVLWDWQAQELGVIDWEYARIGDPAYDLAILTRGHGRPFGYRGGLQRLIDSYLNAGGLPVTKSDVINHELLMVLRHLEQVLFSEESDYEAPEQCWNQLRAIMRRVARQS